jgi:hypothetical protein
MKTIIYIDWWPTMRIHIWDIKSIIYIDYHIYEILSLYMSVNIESNIYTGLTHHENTHSMLWRCHNIFSCDNNGVYHS